MAASRARPRGLKRRPDVRDDGTSRGACSFSAMASGMRRQRPRGACRERPRRGHRGH